MRKGQKKERYSNGPLLPAQRKHQERQAERTGNLVFSESLEDWLKRYAGEARTALLGASEFDAVTKEAWDIILNTRFITRIR